MPCYQPEIQTLILLYSIVHTSLNVHIFSLLPISCKFFFHLFTAGDHANRSQDDSLEEGSHFSEVVNGQIGVVNKQEGFSPNKKSSKAKNQFPCPKCNKVWNWPWELRRHLVMHFKEVCFDFQVVY